MSNWSIDADLTTTPSNIRSEFDRIVSDLEDSRTGWEVRLVDTNQDVPGRSKANYFAVLTREKPSKTDEASTNSTRFGDLETVRAMNTNKKAIVIGFDTEFTEIRGAGRNRVDSYQFSVTTPDDVAHEVVILPLDNGNRIYLEDALYIVSLAAGLHRYSKAKDLDPRGVLFGDHVKRNGNDVVYKKTMDNIYNTSAIRVVLAGHFLHADLTHFKRPPTQRRGGEKYVDILHRITSASGGWVTLMPFRSTRRSGKGSNSKRWLPFSVTVRDTMCQVDQGHKTLKAIGETCGVTKIELPDGVIEDMSAYRQDHLTDFLEYGVNDAVIVSEFLTTLWGRNIVPPVTLVGGSASAVKEHATRYMGLPKGNAAFLATFCGLVKITDPEVEDLGHQLEYYSVRSLRPVDGDADQALKACSEGYHGGWNSCMTVGEYEGKTYDYDIQSAYPSAMAALMDIDYLNGCIEEVIKNRELTLDDFPNGYTTPLIAYVSWEFPDDVTTPSIPVVAGDSIIYPLTSEGAGAAQGDDLTSYDGFEGAWVFAPELLTALKLGATVKVQIGYKLRVLKRSDGTPSMSLRAALKSMVEDRSTAKKLFGKGSLQEQSLKTVNNGAYGKLAQDVSEQHSWNSFREEMEAVGGSSITSPYLAGMTTSLTRALLIVVANRVEVLSATTDGFISAATDIESLDAFGLADVFRDSRKFLSGDPTVWEIKHEQDVLYNWSTRANAAPTDGGVLAHGGLKTPDHITKGSVADREHFIEQCASREGKIPNPYTGFPTTRELTRSKDRKEFIRCERNPNASTIDFDFKRKPVRDSMTVTHIKGHEVACINKTVPWRSVTEYSRARRIVKHMQTYRHGTKGDNRPSGCLKTKADWDTYFVRFEAAPGKCIRSASTEFLKQMVAAHKAGRVTIDKLNDNISVDEKIDWLSTLGFGEFTRSMWDNMSKKDRQEKILEEVDLDNLTTIVDELNGGGGVTN